MDILTIVLGVLTGALLSNLPGVKSLSERVVYSARMASMDAKLPENDYYGKPEHPKPK